MLQGLGGEGTGATGTVGTRFAGGEGTGTSEGNGIGTTDGAGMSSTGGSGTVTVAEGSAEPGTVMSAGGDGTGGNDTATVEAVGGDGTGGIAPVVAVESAVAVVGLVSVAPPALVVGLEPVEFDVDVDVVPDVPLLLHAATPRTGTTHRILAVLPNRTFVSPLRRFERTTERAAPPPSVDQIPGSPSSSSGRTRSLRGASNPSSPVSGHAGGRRSAPGR